jgi:hypothetical protein
MDLVARATDLVARVPPPFAPSRPPFRRAPANEARVRPNERRDRANERKVAANEARSLVPFAPSRAPFRGAPANEARVRPNERRDRMNERRDRVNEREVADNDARAPVPFAHSCPGVGRTFLSDAASRVAGGGVPGQRGRASGSAALTAPSGLDRALPKGRTRCPASAYPGVVDEDPVPRSGSRRRTSLIEPRLLRAACTLEWFSLASWP